MRMRPIPSCSKKIVDTSKKITKLFCLVLETGYLNFHILSCSCLPGLRTVFRNMSKSQWTEVPANACSDAEMTAAQDCPDLSHSDEQRQHPKQQKSSTTNLQDVTTSSAHFVDHHRDSSKEKLGDSSAVCKHGELDEVGRSVNLNTSETQAGNEDLKELTDVNFSGENRTLGKEKLQTDKCDDSDECPVFSDRKRSKLDLRDTDVNCSNELDHCNSASNGDCSSGKPVGTLEASDVESNFATIDISDSLKTSMPNFENSQVTKSASEVGESGACTSDKPLRDCWHSLFEIRQRETGYTGRQNGTCAFTHRACGSVHLVQRLVRYTTLNGHSGCVNALHFNDSGNWLSTQSCQCSKRF